MYKKITLFQKLIVCAWLFGVIALFASFLNSQNVHSRQLSYQAGFVTRQQTEATTWKSNQIVNAILSGKPINIQAAGPVIVVGNPAQQIINKILMGVAQAVFKFVLSQLQKIADMIMNFLEGITDMFNKLVGVISGSVVWLQDLMRTNVDLCKNTDQFINKIAGLAGLAYAKSPLEYAFSNSVKEVNQSATGMLASGVVKNVKYAWNSIANPNSVTARALGVNDLLNEVGNTLKLGAVELAGSGLNAAFCSKENKVIHTGETAVAAAKKEEEFAIASGIELGGQSKIKQMAKAYANTAFPIAGNNAAGFNGSVTQSKSLDAAAAKIGYVVKVSGGAVQKDSEDRLGQLPGIGLFSGSVIQDSTILKEAETKAQVKDITQKIALTAKDAKVGIIDTKLTGNKIAVLSDTKCEDFKSPTLTSGQVPSLSNIAQNKSFLDSIQVNALSPFDSSVLNGTINIGIPSANSVLTKPVYTCEETRRTKIDDTNLAISKTVTVEPPRPVEQAQPSLQSLFQDFINKVVEIGKKLIDSMMKLWNKIVSTFQELLNIFNNSGNALSSILTGGASGGQILGTLVGSLDIAKSAIGSRVDSSQVGITQNGNVPTQYPLGAYRNIRLGETIVFNPLTDGGTGINVGGAKITKIFGQDVTPNTKVNIPFGGSVKPIEVTLLSNSQEMQFTTPNNDGSADPLPLGPLAYKVTVQSANNQISEITIYINVTNNVDDQVPIN